MNNYYVDSIKCLGKLPFKDTTRQIVPAYTSANKCWDKKISSSGKSAQVGLFRAHAIVKYMFAKNK